LVPFVLAAVASTLKTIGAVTTCQKINDAAWKRPEMDSIRKGVAADGLATIIAGCLGSTGQNSATSGIGVSTATGATSRFIAIAIAAWFIVMACSPILRSLFVVMPDPVMGGALMFSACYILVSGIQIITSRLLDSRRTAIVGFTIILVVTREAFPQSSEGLAFLLQPFLGSGLATGLSVAMLLNAIFRVGVRRRETLRLESANLKAEDVWSFFHTQGAKWAARKDVVDRVSQAVAQLIETIRDSAQPRGSSKS
jgi:xanthine permease XanP